jgi:hypothetical protein
VPVAPPVLLATWEAELWKMWPEWSRKCARSHHNREKAGHGGVHLPFSNYGKYEIIKLFSKLPWAKRKTLSPK